MSMERLEDRTFMLFDLQSSHVKNLVSVMPMLAFHFYNELITPTLSAECDQTDTTIKDAVSRRGTREIVKE